MLIPYKTAKRQAAELPLAEVLHFTADAKYVSAWTYDGREVLLTHTLRQLLELCGDAFVQISRSTLLRRQALAPIQGDSIGGRYWIDTHGARLSVSRRQLKAVRDAIKQQEAQDA